MKITCTEEEKEYLINAIVYSSECPFFDKGCKDSNDCAGCVEREIEWEVTDDG